jgi:hypothetical protein
LFADRLSLLAILIIEGLRMIRPQRSLLVVALLTISFVVYPQGKYTNPVSGYSIQYDAHKYRVEVGWDETFFILRDETNDPVYGTLITINPKDPWFYSMQPNATMRDSIFAVGLNDAKNSCDAEGDEGSSSCKEILNLSQYNNQNGLCVLKFHLFLESTHRGIEKDFVVGPCYLIDISKGSVPKALLVTFKYGKKASSVDEMKLDEVAQSISIF